MEFALYSEIASQTNLNSLRESHFEMCTTTLWTEEVPMPTFEFYLKQTSIENAKELAEFIDEKILQESTKEGQQLKLTRYISEIDAYLQKFEADDLIKTEYSFFINDLLNAKLEILAHYEHMIASPSTSKIPVQNKIQWVGNINLLTTLFYDLLNGQVKGIGKNKITTPPLIKAQKKDIAKLLAENFIDVNAKPLKEVTISDYLNTSVAKSSSKLPSGSRIELPEK